MSTLIEEVRKAMEEVPECASADSISRKPFTFPAPVGDEIVLRRDIERGQHSSAMTTLRRGVSFYPQTSENKGLVDSPGLDFLFLFDLIAHTCGKAATLRVLSFSAPSFHDFCKPQIQVTNSYCLLSIYLSIYLSIFARTATWTGMKSQSGLNGEMPGCRTYRQTDLR